MNHPSHSSALAPSAAAGSAVRCGCEAGAVVGPSGCSSLLHGAPSHQIVPVDDSPALTSVAPGLEGDHRLHEMVRACAALNRDVAPPAGFASLSDWLLTLCVTGTIRSFFALAYDGRIAASPLDNRGRERKRKLSVSPELCGFTAMDSKAHALRDCKDLVDALLPMGVFQPVSGMSAAVMAKPLTGLRVFRQLGFPATLLRHAIRLCGGARVHSFFVQFARGIYNARVARGVALPVVPMNVSAELTLCFWLHYCLRNHAQLALTPQELQTMIEALRRDSIFVPLLADCKTSLRPLIAQIVALNMRVEQHHNRAQFPALLDGQHPPPVAIDQAAGGAAAASSVAASSRMVDHQAVLAAAAAAGSAAAGPSAYHSAVPSIDRFVFAGAMRPSELSSPPSSPSLSSVGSARSSSSRASSLAPTSAASSLSRSSTPSRWSSMEDDETDSHDASQGHLASIFPVDEPIRQVDLGYGAVESPFDEVDPTEHNDDEDPYAVPNKRQRLPAFDRSDLDLQPLIMAQFAPPQCASMQSEFVFASPVAAVPEQPYIPLQHQLAPSAPAMASGSDAPNALPVDSDSFLDLDSYFGASSPVDFSSASPRDY